MASVFLSYARSDAARARQLARALERAGHDVWWDKRIKGGARYFRRVLRKIPARIATQDRLWLAIAAYNIGFGHLEDARILTQMQGGNPDEWEQVRERLPLLSEEKWHKRVPRGYAEDPARHLSRTFEEVGGYDEIVLLKDIPFQSHCEHHMAPIIGKAAIAYLPQDKVVGISKLARVLHGYARRLQVQERLTAQVADAIWAHLKPQGVAVVIEATHACMTARGVSTPDVMMTTSRMMGVFRDDERSRREVLALMGY